MHVNEEETKEKADQTIASVPNEVDYEYDNGCMGYHHSTKCPASYDGDSECILDMVDEALHLKRRLGMLFLLRNCARDPRKANGLNTLEGMAQERCIYDLRYDVDRILSRHANMDLGESIYLGINNHICMQTR
jgi:hypothetical protein